MTELSPQAQAVLDVPPSAPHLQIVNRAYAAAVLRAAADRTEADSIWTGHPEHTGVRWAAGQWRAIAAELDGDQAKPEPEAVGPTDEELLATLDNATADFPPRHPEAEALNAVEYPLALELRKARAVLARFGHQPAPPAEGEVGEL